MVHTVKDWETFSGYAQNIRQGFYIEKPALDNEVEVRIVAGRLGFQTSLAKENACYEQIKEFLRVHRFIKIETSIDVDVFLR